jgi:excisionase family DNA binding protein
MTTFTLDSSPQQIQEAKEAAAALSALMLSTKRRTRYIHLHLTGSDQPIAVPTEAVKIVVDVLRQLSSGGSAALILLDEELTTQQAANMLKVSRPFLVGLLDAGKIPSRKVGKHRRVRMEDLIAYQQAEEQIRTQRLNELTAEAQKLHLGY